MAAPRFLAFLSGRFTEVVATVLGGAGNEEKIISTDASGRLDASLLPTGIGADTANIVTSEALSAGNLVNVYNDAGAAKVRKADATTPGKEAHGFVINGFASGASAVVYFEGTNAGLTGLTPGPQFLSTSTPGNVQPAAPTVAGQIAQKIGFATGTGVLNFQYNEPVTRA